MAIYKEQGFLPDNKAVAYEFTLVNNRAGIIRFTTARGTSVTVHPKSDVFFVPYPGKDPEAEPAGVLLLIQHAAKKYPQYGTLWKNLEAAWKREAALSKEEATKNREDLRKKQGIVEKMLFWVQEKQFFHQTDARTETERKRSLKPLDSEENLSGEGMSMSATLGSAETETTSENQPSYQHDVGKKDLEAIRRYYEFGKKLTEGE